MTQSTLPRPDFGWTHPSDGKPTQAFAQFMTQFTTNVLPLLPLVPLVSIVTFLTSLSTGILTLTLKNAANDAAAATAGVPVNGLYRNGSVLMIRVT